MVSEMPLFALKFKSFAWKGNEAVYIFIILAAIMLPILKFVAIPLIIVLYVVVSAIANAIKSPDKKQI